jgi:hypothetical protein
MCLYNSAIYTQCICKPKINYDMQIEFGNNRNLVECTLPIISV